MTGVSPADAGALRGRSRGAPSACSPSASQIDVFEAAAFGRVERLRELLDAEPELVDDVLAGRLHRAPLRRVLRPSRGRRAPARARRRRDRPRAQRDGGRAAAQRGRRRPDRDRADAARRRRRSQRRPGGRLRRRSTRPARAATRSWRSCCSSEARTAPLATDDGQTAARLRARGRAHRAGRLSDVIELRSDTLTQPTPAMRQAIAERRGRRRAEARGPDGQRARGPRRRVARPRGGRLPADGHDGERDRASPAQPSRRRAARRGELARADRRARRAGRVRRPADAADPDHERPLRPGADPRAGPRVGRQPHAEDAGRLDREHPQQLGRTRAGRSPRSPRSPQSAGRSTSGSTWTALA